MTDTHGPRSSTHEPDATRLGMPRSITNGQSSSANADAAPPNSTQTVGNSSFDHQNDRRVATPGFVQPDEETEKRGYDSHEDDVPEIRPNHEDILDAPESANDEEEDGGDGVGSGGTGGHTEIDDDADDGSEDETTENFYAILPKKRSKTKAEREASRGKKSGNPGRFRGPALVLMEKLYIDYDKVDKRKGIRGKLKRLDDFWHRARSAIWEAFSWEDLDHDGIGDKTQFVAAVNAAVPRWFQWRDSHISIGTRNPWIATVSALRKPEGHAPKKVAPYILYASRHASRIAAACPGGNIGDRNKKARELLEKEPEEVQRQFEEESKTRFDREKKKFEDAVVGLPSVDPDEQKKARDRLASVMTPFLELVAQYTGFTCVTLIGGMAVEDSWVCNAVNYGKTRDSVPMKFDEFDAAGFRKNFCGQFTKFLKACTSNGQAPAVGQTETPAESSTALTTAAPSSLPTTRPPSPSSLNPHTPCSTALHSNHGGNGHTTLPSERPPSRNVSPRQASPSSVCTDDLPDKLNDAVARRFSKLSPEDKIEELQRLQDLDEDEIVRENAIAVRDEMLLSLSLTGPQSLFGEFGAIATSKKAKAKAKPKPKKKTAANTKSKPRPRRGLRSSGLQDDTDDAPRTDSAGGQADADNSADSGRDDVPERHSDDNSNGGAPGGSSNARGSGGARNDGDGGDDARNGDDAPDRGANGGSDPNPDVEGGAGASTPLPDVEERTMSMSSPAAPAANQHDASAYIVDVSGTPQWFAEQYRALVQFGEDLASEQREQWLTTLNTWFDLERLSGFAETKPGLKTAYRPPEVALWIQNARKYHIVPKNRAAYKTQWWKWWIAVNPSWRKVEDERPVTGSAGDWTSLFKSGRNGFLTVLGSLAGLQQAVTAEEWGAAVTDVQWVIGEVCQAKHRPGRKHPRTDEGENENNGTEEPEAKRQRRAPGRKITK